MKVELRTFFVVDDEVYEATITEVSPPGKDGSNIPLARTFEVCRGGEEVDWDALSDEAVVAIYDKLDDKSAEAWHDVERAERRARWAKVIKL